MLPTVHILGHTVAMYGLLISIGAFLGCFVSLIISRRTQLKSEDVIFSFIYALLGVIIGGKIFYFMVEFPNIWASRQFYMNYPEQITYLFTGGFVFYGGFIGAVIGVFIYTKQYNIPIESLVYIFTPAVPLIHAVGRIGCFFAGCCYGKPYSGPFSVVFKDSLIAPSTYPVFPVQLFESVINVFIFIVLLWALKKVKNGYSLMGLYIVMYSVARFVLEFFRGDLERGFVLIFSTSQWMSIVLLVVGIRLCLHYRGKRYR